MYSHSEQKIATSKPPPPSSPHPQSIIATQSTQAPSALASPSTLAPNLSNPSSPDANAVVIQHLHYSLPFVAGRQELCLRHCVQKVFISSFYGEFTIYDAQNRVLGKSKDSKLSFMKNDLKTDIVGVWYDAMALQNEFSTLQHSYKVLDPGLFFNFGNVLIEFEKAPEANNNRVYPHIPIFFNVTNVWNATKSELLFK
jgi:hypothetical protein